MGRRGDAYDNALCEAFFATLEREVLDRYRFRTREEARSVLFTYLEGFYNRRRRDSAVGCVSPEAFERRWWTGHESQRYTRQRKRGKSTASGFRGCSKVTRGHLRESASK